MVPQLHQDGARKASSLDGQLAGSLGPTGDETADSWLPVSPS